ncbi:unnamed protein product [Periconia digitata]|uniref:Uncharacterized protein n=1 Tax=Periconia digitata TaxID=1303443 RepID=A0A9W4UII4_9PLEO|nr:unnamed protein product [Periconia digitata]
MLIGVDTTRTHKLALNRPCACVNLLPASNMAYPGHPASKILRYLPAKIANSFSGTNAANIHPEHIHTAPMGMVTSIIKIAILCRCNPTCSFFPVPYACAHSVSKLVARPS